MSITYIADVITIKTSYETKTAAADGDVGSENAANVEEKYPHEIKAR